MANKRLRTPKAKCGELKAQWGKLPDCSPDMVYAWGEGCSKCDANLLNSLFHGEEYSVLRKEYMPSFINEMIERGYDITTLKFSIQKKK